MKYRCPGITDDGTRCKRTSQEPGFRCYQHRGLRAFLRASSSPKTRGRSASKTRGRSAPSAKAARRRSQTTRGNIKHEKSRTVSSPRTRNRVLTDPEVSAAASFCIDAYEKGEFGAIATRAARTVGDRTWGRLRRRWRPGRCRFFARTARRILRAKDDLHNALGRLALEISTSLGVPRIERVFLQEVVRRLPLPVDQQMVAAARAVQAVGIYLCIVAGRDLSKCACFVDVLEHESRAKLKELLIAAGEDWSALATKDFAGR